MNSYHHESNQKRMILFRSYKISKRIPFFIICVTISLLCACSNNRIVQPLNKNQWQASASIGGPMVSQSDKYNPVPLTSISAAYGYTRSTTLYTGYHPTTAYYGIDHLDLGYAQELIRPRLRTPGLSYALTLNTFRHRSEGDFKFYPQLDVNIYWLLAFRKDYTYIGISNWVELARKKAHDEPVSTHWIPAMHAGYTLQANRWSYNLELKYLAPLTNNQDLLVNYYSPTNKGALSLYFSISRKFK